MEQNPSWEANLFSASQEIPSILWNPKVHYSIHSRWPPITLYHILYLGISQLGHNSRFSSNWSCMCVSWSLSYSTLFQSDLLPHLQSLCSTHASALCSWVPLGGTWEHKGLQSGVQTVKVGNNLPCGVHYCKFFTFFQFGGEHSVNRGWLCTREDVHQVCGNRPLLHQGTMGLAQEWTPLMHKSSHNSTSFIINKYTLFLIHIAFPNSCSSSPLDCTLPHLHHQVFTLSPHIFTYTF